MAKIMEIISKETGGKSYNTEKYSYDTIGMPSFDYDDDGRKIYKNGKCPGRRKSIKRMLI